MSQPVILAARRTPIGRFLGGFSRVPAPKLGTFAIEAALADAGDARSHVDECIMGCVLQAGLGQNPARQSGLHAGLPDTLNAMTVNKVCGSGLQAVMLAAQSIKAGDNHVVVAGGMENMTVAPHFASVRAGVKFGDVSREEQDRYAAQSHQRAAAATGAGHFANELIALTGEQVGNRRMPGPEGGVSADEGIRGDSTPEVLAKLPNVFAKDGTVTAGNASQISDGAAALIVASEAKASELGVTPMARIVDYYTSGVAPKDIFHAPALGITALLERNGIGVGDVDLVELNEAFAAQTLANIKVIGIPEEKLNICGGGIALGHPIGASGARVLTTLLHQLARTGGTRGIASLCLGGGNSVSMLVERSV